MSNIQHIGSRRASMRWWFLVALGLVMGCLCSSVYAASKYPQQRCLELLQRDEFRKAALCTTKLMKRVGGFKYLLSLGLIHEKAGEYHAGQRSGESCYHFDRAVSYYRRYLRGHRRLRKKQRAYLKHNVARLVQRSRYAQLSLASRPGAVNVVLQGSRRKWVVRLPHTFKAICPGSYQLQASKKGFQSTRKVLRLKQDQKLTHQLQLRLTPQRPFRMPAWGWTLIGAGGVGALGGVLYFLAENRRQTLEARSGQDVAWKENRDIAQGLSIGAVSLFVGAGAMVGAAVLVSLIPRSRPKVQRELRLPSTSKGALLPTNRSGMVCWSGDGISWGASRCR